MIWLSPAAWFGIVALAAPLLTHLLVHRRAEPVPFPTLQFLKPTRLASIRRHLLEDIALLIVRASILALAVAALAGPLLVTALRRASWNSRVARAIVVDIRGADAATRTRLAQAEGASAFQSRIIETADGGEGMRRAVAWLDDAPPARREIVWVSPLTIGAVTAANLAAVPQDVGVRLVRSGTPPATRTVDVAPVLTWADTQVGPHGGEGVAADPRVRRADPRASADVGADLRVRPRTATLNGPATLVADGDPTSRLPLPIEIVAPDDQRAAVDAAVSAVAAGRTLVPAPNQSARLVLAGAPDASREIAGATIVKLPWIGDAIAGIARDEDLRRAASDIRVTNADPRLRNEPWQPIAAGADGTAAVVAAQSADRLIIVSAAPATDFLTPVLIRSTLNALAAPINLRAAEIVPIPDAQLRRWERPPSDVSARVPLTNVDDDRRWFWAAALGLIAVETWMRRSRARTGAELETSEEPVDRVA